MRRSRRLRLGKRESLGSSSVCESCGFDRSCFAPAASLDFRAITVGESHFGMGVGPGRRSRLVIYSVAFALGSGGHSFTSASAIRDRATRRRAIHLELGSILRVRGEEGLWRGRGRFPLLALCLCSDEAWVVLARLEGQGVGVRWRRVGD